jgi:hypothetical protein
VTYLRPVRAIVLLAALCAMLALPALATADDGDDVRRTGRCTRSSDIELRLRADDGTIRVEVRIDAERPGRWSLLLLHERRIAFRGVVRPAGSSDDVRLRRNVADWFGRDAVTVRAKGPRLEACAVSAAL